MNDTLSATAEERSNKRRSPAVIFFMLLIVVSDIAVHAVSYSRSRHMATDINRLDSALTVQKEQAAQQHKTDSDIRHLKQDAVNREQKIQKETDRLKKLLETIKTEITTVQSEQKRLSDQFSALNTRIAVTEDRIKKSEITVTPAIPVPVPVTKKTLTAKHQSDIRQLSAEALPFIVTSTEMRGGQWYAVVVPRASPAQLSSVQLLAPADQYRGWTLQRVSSTSVTFRSHGNKGGSHTITLNVK